VQSSHRYTQGGIPREAYLPLYTGRHTQGGIYHLLHTGRHTQGGIYIIIHTGRHTQGGIYLYIHQGGIPRKVNPVYTPGRYTQGV